MPTFGCLDRSKPGLAQGHNFKVFTSSINFTVRESRTFTVQIVIDRQDIVFS